MNRRLILSLLLIGSASLAMAQVLQGYQYWVDADYSGRHTAEGSSEALALSLDLDALPVGLHYLHFRAYDTDGDWGVIERVPFYWAQTPLDSAIARYQYWFDDDYASAVDADYEGNVALELDVSSLSPGIHYFHFRARKGADGWGTIERHMFTVPSFSPAEDEATPVGYQYWLDSDYSSAVFVETAETSATFSLDISSLSDGVHYLHVRTLGSDSIWGGINRQPFAVDSEASVGDSIYAYRYGFNSFMTVVPLAEPVASLSWDSEAIAFPQALDVASVADGDFTFDTTTDNVTMQLSCDILFSLQFQQSDGAWFFPIYQEMAVNDTVAKLAEPLSLQEAATFDMASIEDFVVVKIVVDTDGTYYLQTTQSCALLLYDAATGKLVLIIDAADLLGSFALSLGEGTYYGILYDMAVGNAASGETFVVTLTTDDVTGIDTLLLQGGGETLDLWTSDATLYLRSTQHRSVQVFNVGGQLVRSVRLTPGVNAVEGLPKGVYVVDGRKVLLHDATTR